MKKENNKNNETKAVLTLLLDANLKNFFTDDAIPLHNFEFQKKKCFIVNKRVFLPKFSEL